MADDAFHGLLSRLAGEFETLQARIRQLGADNASLRTQLELANALGQVAPDPECMEMEPVRRHLATRFAPPILQTKSDLWQLMSSKGDSDDDVYEGDVDKLKHNSVSGTSSESQFALFELCQELPCGHLSTRAGMNGRRTSWSMWVDRVTELWPVWSQNMGEDEYMEHWYGHSEESGYRKAGSGNTVVRAGDALRDEGLCLQYLVARPTSVRRIGWDIMSILLVTYDMFYIPLQAFDLPLNTLTLSIDWTSCSFWTIDIFFSFLVGFHNGGVIEMRPSKIARRYIKTWFPLDFFVVFVDWTILVADVGLSDALGMIRLGKVLRLARVLRMFRLLRIVKVIKLLSEVGDIIHSESMLTVVGIFKLMAGMFIVTHFFACGWYAVATAGFEEGQNWVHQLEVDEGYVPSLGYYYTTSLHWSFTQFTPASMEVFPRNVAERIYSVCVLMCALLMFSSFVSSITTAMSYLREINMDRARQSEYVRRYITEHRVSLDLGNRIYGFFRQNNYVQKKQVVEKDVAAFRMLPDALRLQLHCEIFSPQLFSHPFFSIYGELDERGVTNICHLTMSELPVVSGEEVFSHGEQASKMYHVAYGSLQYFFGVSDQVTENIHMNQYLCDMVLWVKWEHRGRLIASATSELFALDAAAFHRVVSRTSSFQQCKAFALEYHEHLLNECARATADPGNSAAGWGPSDVSSGFGKQREIAERVFDVGDDTVGQQATERFSVARMASRRPSINGMVGLWHRCARCARSLSLRRGACRS